VQVLDILMCPTARSCSWYYFGIRGKGGSECRTRRPECLSSEVETDIWTQRSTSANIRWQWVYLTPDLTRMIPIVETIKKEVLYEHASDLRLHQGKHSSGRITTCIRIRRMASGCHGRIVRLQCLMWRNVASQGVRHVAYRKVHHSQCSHCRMSGNPAHVIRLMYYHSLVVYCEIITVPLLKAVALPPCRRQGRENV
jgi:hypothetical protein